MLPAESIRKDLPTQSKKSELLFLGLSMESLAPGKQDAGAPRLPPWEHLGLLARWYYSSFREGELVMLNPGQAMPHARLIRICRKLLAADAPPTAPAKTETGGTGL